VGNSENLGQGDIVLEHAETRCTPNVVVISCRVSMVELCWGALSLVDFLTEHRYQLQ
jgi:hypothetical protein